MTLIPEQLISDVRKMSRAIGVPDDFLLGLSKEKDWAFVVMTHAFMEALITRAITVTLCRDELSAVLSHVEMGNVQAGKVAIAKALQLVDDEGKRFLTYLTKLRNSVVHNVAQIDFDFMKYYASLNANQRKEFAKAFSYFSSDEDKEEHPDLVKDVVASHPKAAVWLSAMHFTGLMFWKQDLEKSRTKLLITQAELRELREAAGKGT